MDDQEDRQPTLDQASQQAGYLSGGTEIELGGRLVRHQCRRVLGQRDRDLHPLELATREGGQQTIGQLVHPRLPERFDDRLAVSAGGTPERSEVRRASDRHRVLDRDPGRDLRELGDEGPGPGELPAAYPADRPTAPLDLPGGRPLKTTGHPGEGRLAGTVRSDDRDQLTPGQGQVDPAEDRAACDLDPDASRFEERLGPGTHQTAFLRR